MNKKITVISTITLAAVLAAPMSVYADTTIQPSGGSPFVIDPTPGTANTTIEFNVNPTYTVTIPATVKLEDDGEGIYTNSGTLSAEDVFLNEGKEIVVTLTSASAFTMATPDAVEYKLPYTVSTEDFGPLTDKTNGGIVAKFATSTEAQSVDVTFATDETPLYAGAYTDPVVFTITVADASDE